MKTPSALAAASTSRLKQSWAAQIIREVAEVEHTEPGAQREARPDEPPQTGREPATGRPSRSGDAGNADGTPGPRWPHTIPVGDTSGRVLAANFSAFLDQRLALLAWAADVGATVTETNRRVPPSVQRVPTHVTIHTIDDAARLAGPSWPERLTRARSRARVLRARFPHAADESTLIAVEPLSDVDFELLCTAADWFAVHTGAGMTPRQVPIEGLHAKWLNTRHTLIATLAGRDTLDLLPRHPTRIHFTYLDPDHRAGGGRVHDSATVGDVGELAYRPRIVVISENKDTAIHFPPIPCGVAVEGVGRGGATAAAFDWIRDADCLIYWGDMDADGLEILDGFRAAGVPARSLFMDLGAYHRWRRYGTDIDAKTRPLTAREPKSTPHLTRAERDLYEHVCATTIEGPRRIEQERIPLDVAATAVLRAALTGT